MFINAEAVRREPNHHKASVIYPDFTRKLKCGMLLGPFPA